MGACACVYNVHCAHVCVYIFGAQSIISGVPGVCLVTGSLTGLEPAEVVKPRDQQGPRDHVSTVTVLGSCVCHQPTYPFCQDVSFSLSPLVIKPIVFVS